MASSANDNPEIKDSTEHYHEWRFFHPGYPRFHRYEDIDYIRTYVDMCLARIPSMAIIDILSREFTDILGVLTDALEYMWWRTGPEETRTFRFRKSGDALDYIVYMVDDVMLLPSPRRAVAKGRLQYKLWAHEEVLKGGLKYLEEQRASHRVGNLLPAYPGPTSGAATSTVTWSAS